VAKIILLVVGLLFVYWILKGYRRRVDRREPGAQAVEGEAMVQCAECGVHLPRGESITTQGRYFCSIEHQRAHRPERHSG